MKSFFLALLLLVAIPAYGQFVLTNLDKTNITVLDSAYRTGTVNTSDFSLPQHRGIRLTVTVIDTQNQSASNTPGITVKIQGRDASTGDYFTLLTSATLIVEGVTTSFVIHPDITAVTNLMAKDVMSLTWRAQIALTDTGYVNYKIGAEPLR